MLDLKANLQSHPINRRLAANSDDCLKPTLPAVLARSAFRILQPTRRQLKVAQPGMMLAPMLLGIVLGAILAGQLLSRAGGHYRMQLLVSTALMTAGMYLFSTLSEGVGFSQSKPILYSQIYLVSTALGFGGIVATLSVAMQNAVPFHYVGVATAALQFCRSLGGMVGLAATGAVIVQSSAPRRRRLFPIM